MSSPLNVVSSMKISVHFKIEGNLESLSDSKIFFAFLSFCLQKLK